MHFQVADGHCHCTTQAAQYGITLGLGHPRPVARAATAELANALQGFHVDSDH